MVLMIFISVSIDTACGAMTFAKRLRPFVDGAEAWGVEVFSVGRAAITLAFELGAEFLLFVLAPMLICRAR